MIMLFLKIKKQSSRLQAWQKYQNFEKFLAPYNLSQVALNLNLFLVSMLLQNNKIYAIEYSIYWIYNTINIGIILFIK